MAEYERGRERERSGSRAHSDHQGSQSNNQPNQSSTQTTSLLVRNFSQDTRPDEIREIFSRYGKIRDVYLPQDYFNRKPRGFAFVEFYEKNDAMEAIGKLDKFNLHGKDLSVELAKDRRKAPDEMKDRTRQAPAPHGARRSRSRSRENNHRGGGRAEGGGYMHEYHRGPPPPDFRMRSDYYRNDYFQRDFPPRDYPRDYQRDYPPRRDLQDRYYYNDRRSRSPPPPLHVRHDHHHPPHHQPHYQSHHNHHAQRAHSPPRARSPSPNANALALNANGNQRRESPTAPAEA